MITAEQRTARRAFVGSSDAPAICGLDPYRSAWDVWAEKTGLADGFEGNKNTDRGNLLEPVVLEWAQDQIGCEFVRGQMLRNGYLAANFDGISNADPVDLPDLSFVVEAKTATNADEWGEPGTDEIPERVIAQVHHQMYVAGPEYRIAYVPVLLPVFGRFDFRLYKVERSDELAAAIADRGRAFWRDHVIPNVPPSDSTPSLEVLRRIRREPAKVVPVADELVDAVAAMRAAKKQACDDCEAAEAALLTALGTAEGGTYSRGTVTYFQSQRKGYTVEPSAFRSLRIKASKGGTA